MITDLALDERIIQYLDGISLPRDAADEFGGVVGHGGSDQVVVYYLTGIDPTVAEADLRQHHANAVDWINHSMVNTDGEPVTTPLPQPIPIVLVPSELTYSDFSEVGMRVASEPWTVDVQHRVQSFWPDYGNRRLVVTITDLAPADIEAARTTFGDIVTLVHGESDPGVSADSTESPSAVPASQTIEIDAGTSSTSFRLTPKWTQRECQSPCRRS